ncbi:MAG: LacI family transcriptional regulator [Spirochaetia bacterium]|jgi:LacI family transcriptional regulator|nr:LacI family transcriptional regulator [Spirochaetia bacterium]
MAVTIKDIAKLADVSTSTVSRCLNDNPRISQTTRDRVKKLAAELGFVPNNSAKSLSTHKTGLVGLVYQESLDEDGSHSYVNALFLNLRRELERLQLDTIQVEAINLHTKESNAIRLIREHKVDGFLFLHAQITEADINCLNCYQIPAVQVHFHPQFTDLRALDFFITDNVYGGYLAGKHLFGKGCKKPLQVGCAPNIGTEFNDRTKGFNMAMKEYGLEADPALHFLIPSDVYSAYHFVQQHFDLVCRCDSIFAQADVVAVGLIQALQSKGIRVPKDIKVVGFDDSYYSRILPPFITTIHQPREEITRKASKRIFDLIKTGSDGRHIQEEIKPYLIEREST